MELNNRELLDDYTSIGLYRLGADCYRIDLYYISLKDMDYRLVKRFLDANPSMKTLQIDDHMYTMGAVLNKKLIITREEKGYSVECLE